jgi:hypothetical protein
MATVMGMQVPVETPVQNGAYTSTPKKIEKPKATKMVSLENSGNFAKGVTMSTAMDCQVIVR